MSTGEDESSPGLNGRLRPRKSTTSTPSPQNKNIRKTEGKLAQDRPKRTNTPSKASPSNQNDLAAKSDTSPAPLCLCPYCDRKFNSRQTASKHARRIHLSTSKQDTFIKCLHCVHSEAEPNAIIKHMVDSHPNQYFACLDCHTRFPSTTELAEHKLNVCEKQKPPYRSKLRQKTSGTKKNPKRLIGNEEGSTIETTQYTDNQRFNGIVISCELKPSEVHDAADVEDKITTNLILPNSKALSNAGMDKNAVIVLDDLQWNKRIPPNFSFHNTDADQILSRLGVVHRSPRVGESKKDLIRLMDEPNEKFEKCFDTSFYSKVAKNVQENLTKYLDGSFNFNPDRDNTIKTRKSKTGVVINTAEGFPILLAYEQFARNLFDGFMPRTMAPKHKWKWDSAENDTKNIMMLLDQTKRDTHVNSCIVTLVSGLDIWTQLRMRRKFEEIFKTAPAAKKAEKQNIINMELKEILESRDIPTTSTQIVKYKEKPVVLREGSELPSYLGLSPTTSKCEQQPAVLSGEWVRPRCYVCCACGEQTRDGRALTTHISSQHPNAQVQHYEIVGETLLSADILKHLYVPPSQISNRTRPPRGFRDCTKCKKSITMEDLHQHMLDCAGDVPTVRRKVRYRPFGVRRRRPRLPDNTIRKKMRKDIRSRHRQKGHMRPRPRIRSDVGDAETIRKMIADLPAKRNRITPSNVLRPRRNVLRAKRAVKLRASEEAKSTKTRTTKNLNKIKKSEGTKTQNDSDNSSTFDEDDQPLKISSKRASTRATSSSGRKDETKNASASRATVNKVKKKIKRGKIDPNMRRFYLQMQHDTPVPPGQLNSNMPNPNMAEAYNRNLYSSIPPNLLPQAHIFHPPILQPHMYSSFSPNLFYNQLTIEQAHQRQLAIEQAHRIDIQAAGPSNIRQHGNRDHYNMSNSNERPVGGRNESNQNNNITPAANVPLKHSIASLTSNNEPRDASVPHFQSNLPPEIRVTGPHYTTEIRQEFENEAAVQEFDIPPLSNDLVGFSETNIPSSEGFRNDIQNLHFHVDLASSSRIPNDLSGPGVQPNEEITIEARDADIRVEVDRSKLNKTRKRLNDCIAMLKTKKGLVEGGFGETEGSTNDNRSGETYLAEYETVNENNSAELQNPEEQEILENKGDDHNLVLQEGNIEFNDVDKNVQGTSASKSNVDMNFVEYQGSNESSAEDKISVDIDILECDKGEESVEEYQIGDGNGYNNSINGGDKTHSTENKFESLETDPRAIVRRLSEENKTYSVEEQSELDLTPAQIFSRSVLPEPYPNENSESNTHHDLTGALHLARQTENAHLLQIPLEFVAPKSNEHEATRSSRTRPTSRTECDMTSNMSGHREMERSHWLEPLPAQSRNVTPDSVLQSSRRNSYEGMQIPLEERLFFQNRMSETMNPSFAMNNPNLTKTIESQAKLHNFTKEQLTMLYNQRIATEMYMQRSNAASTSDNAAQVAYNNFVKANMTTQWQANVSPTKKSRRKPTKNDLIREPPPPYNYKKNVPRKKSTEQFNAASSTTVPTMPVPTMSAQPLPGPSRLMQSLPVPALQNMRKSPEAFNMPLTNTTYLPPPSMGVTNPKSETRPASRPRRLSYKRVLNSSENGPNVVDHRDDNSHSKMYKTSPESNNESTSSSENLVRMDSLMAQGRLHERDLCDSPSSSRGQSKSQVKFPEELKRSSEDNACSGTPKDLHFRNYVPNFASMHQNTHGTIYVNPESENRDIVNSNSPTPRELQHVSKMSYEEHKKQFPFEGMQKQRSKSNSESKSEESFESQLNNHQFRAIVPTPAIESTPHRPGINKSSLEYYTRSSPYQSNITNMSPSNVSDHSIEIGYDEHSHLRENPLHTYSHTTHTIGAPKIPYSESVYRAIPSMSSSHEPIREEATPLDLSCDSKFRAGDSFDARQESSEINEIESNESLTMNMQQHYSEQLRNSTSHPHLPSYKDFNDCSYKPDDEFCHLSVTDVTENSKESGNKRVKLSKYQEDHCSSSIDLDGEFEARDAYCTNKVSKSESSARIQNMTMNYRLDNNPTHQQAPNDTNYSGKSEILDLNNSNPIKHSYGEHTICRVSDMANESNDFSEDSLSRLPKREIFTPINRQESMKERSFIENKKIARTCLTQANPTILNTTFEEKTYAVNNTPLVENTNSCVVTTAENIESHTHLDKEGDRNTTLNMSTKHANEMTTINIPDREGKLETNIVKTNAQNCQEETTEKDSIDQDPETARKIAMLPKELLDILGTMPKDHRNQLLNVLPQYVTPANKMSSASSVPVTSNNTDTLQIENKQQTTVCNELNKLSVNTAISPSSIIPKKRHSPSQSIGRLNSNESKSNLSTPSHISTLPQSTLIGLADKPVKESNLDLSRSIKNRDPESSVMDSVTDMTSQKSLPKNSNITVTNVVDVENVNTSMDASILQENSLPALTRDLTSKTSAKPRNSNEQTASLRAVRIKTTSAAKILSDDKKSQPNYNYHNLETVEKATKPIHIDTMHYRYGKINDLQYDKERPQYKNRKDDMMGLASTSVTMENDYRNAVETMRGPTTLPNKIRENNDNLVPILSNNFLVGSDVPKKVVPEAVTLLSTNIEQDHFLEPTNLTIFSDSNEKDNVTLQKCGVTFITNNNINTQEQFQKATSSPSLDAINPKFDSKTETKEINEKSVVLLASSEYNDAQLNSKQSSQCITFEKSVETSELLIQSKDLQEESLLKSTDCNEDDSDDDLSLAVIKQKQKAETEFITTANKKNRFSSKLINKKKKKMSKQLKPSPKMKLLLNTEMVQSQNITLHCNNTSNDPSDMEVSFNHKEAQLNLKTTETLSISTKDVDCKESMGIYEFDVNKENSVDENINKIKYGDNSQMSDHEPIENQLDNSNDKNIYDANNINQQPGVVSQSSVSILESIKEGAAELSNDYEINEKTDSDIHAKLKKNKTLTSLCLENKNLSDKNEIAFEIPMDTGDRNESNLYTSSKNEILDKNSAPDGVELKELSETGTKFSTKSITFAITEESIVSDLQLCSEIPETKYPLRRSRRGKSMYADSSYLQDNEHEVLNEDIGHKTPLTMKRLILSRVEKDNKRIIQSNISGKDSETADDKPISDTETKEPCIKKSKLVKRKKSPHTRRKYKKAKLVSNYQNEEDISDANISNTSENTMSILRELSNAENKIKDKDSLEEEIKSFTDTTSSLTEKPTLVNKEKLCEVNDDDIMDMSMSVRESTVAEKRKLNMTNITDLTLLKAKKPKYNDKATSDFDSDDEKGLLATKQNILHHNQLMVDTDTINISTKTVDDNEHNILDKPTKICEGLNVIPKQISNVNMIGETRITCYSRPNSVRRPRSSSATFKVGSNYDPYDIDFEDMIEPSVPIIKKKGRNTGNNNAKYHQDNTFDVKSENTKLSNLNVSSQKYNTEKEDTSKISTNINNESDSDSSKSDVPLQKYLDAKRLLEPKNKNDTDINTFANTTECQEVTPKSDNTKVTVTNSALTVNNEESADLNVKIARSSSKGKKSVKRVNKDASLCKAETTNIVQNLNTNNNTLAEPPLHKRQNKEKKNRRTLSVYNNVDSVTESNELQSKEEDQQMKSDKFMENFGFYSERIPRKSNLLASKKISETFHMISNESDESYFAYKEKSSKKSTQSEIKKKSETSSDHPATEDARNLTSDGTSSSIQPNESRMDVVEPCIANEPYDEKKIDDSEVDSITAQKIMESEEVRNLENDLISSFKEAANAAQDCVLETIAPIEDTDSTVLIMHTEESSKIDETPGPIKKTSKSKPNKQPGVKELMYPEEEIEIDMFEDKFDKIKRKRRSQAVAAKQVQNIVETNASVKTRRPSEKKKTTKNTKKNYKSAQVPTKGALKGFDGIKISIRTQDLNMPPSVSSPGQQKKRKKVTNKRRKETCDTESSCSESDEKDKHVLERDIYEFKDSEDTELLELRPSTVMDRFRIMHNKTKLKLKDKGKGDGEKEKEKQRDRKEKKAETKEKDLDDKEKNKEREKKNNSKHEGRSKEKVIEAKHSLGETSSKFNENTHTTKMRVDQQGGTIDNIEEPDRAVASTSRFVLDRVDESDYESELSSPEGEFIFYMSDDVNCVCPSDNDSDVDSDIERGCGRPNCIYKIRNADKNAAIGNIFKNNAVRFEKPETKVPEQPRPNLDQLFDSLFESKPTNNDVVNGNAMENATEKMDLSSSVILSSGSNQERNTRKSLSPVSQSDLHTATSTKEPITLPLIEGFCSKSPKDPVSLLKPSVVTAKNKSSSKNTKSDKICTAKSGVLNTCSLYQNEITSDSDSIQNFTSNDKPKDELRYSIMTEECTQVQLEDIIADEKVAQNEANENSTTKMEHSSLKTATTDHTTKYDSEDEFDINKPESLKREYMHYILPTDKVSSCAQTENKSDHSDAESGNESDATKYIKRLSPSETAKKGIYKMVTAQGTQTLKPKKHTYSLSISDDEVDDVEKEAPRGRIRLQKFDITDISYNSSKSIQTDRTRSKSSKYDVIEESDDDNDVIDKSERCNNDRATKTSDSAKGKRSTGSSGVYNEDNEMSPPEDSFAAPASRPVDKHSPRKSDEGISTSHDYSADAFDLPSFEDTGVACQRARRKCTVGKQNVLAEHWSSESEFDGHPPRPNSADSVAASAGRKKKGKKKEGHHSGGRKGNRHASKNEGKGVSGVRSDSIEACAGPSRAPPGPKIRARPAHHYWSSDGEETSGPQPQHGWIVGDSHKKLVTMLAHAKGRKRNNSDKRHYLD